MDVVFGLPGGVLLPLYDAIYKSDICHILVRHEQGAAHMADGYARATGKVEYASPPRLWAGLNLVTGIANAYMDSVPMVAITGQVNTWLIGKDAFRGGYHRHPLPITKHNYLIRSAKEILGYSEAFIARTVGLMRSSAVDLPGCDCG